MNMPIVGYPYNPSVTNAYPNLDYSKMANPTINTPYVMPQYNPGNINVIWISDEDEAKRYPIGPNSAVVLWDAKANKIYLKKADATGNPSMKVYELIEEVKAEEVSPTYVTEESFKDISKLVNDLMGEVKDMKKDIYGVVGKKGSK